MSRVSICIPSYKPEHFDLCLASAVAQTFRDTEILVSDDCPTDEIRQICDQFGERVVYSRNPNQGGWNNALRLMDMAEGEYVKFLFDDDVLHPFCVQLLVQALEETRAQNTTLAFSPRDVIDTNNNLLRTLNFLNLPGPNTCVLEGSHCIALMAGNCLNFIGEFTTTLFRREDCFDATGRNTLTNLDKGPVKGLGDVAAWLNLATKGSVVAHPMSLSYFREHADSNSNPSANPDFISAITDWETIIDHAVARGLLPGQQSFKAYERLAKMYMHWLPTFHSLATDLECVMQKMKAAA